MKLISKIGCEISKRIDFENPEKYSTFVSSASSSALISFGHNGVVASSINAIEKN